MVKLVHVYNTVDPQNYHLPHVLLLFLILIIASGDRIVCCILAPIVNSNYIEDNDLH